ncbi:conserved hypothetical protein [Enterobacterales bacterium 8AC]|nr:conserved hypothetical protein [Enterobacterales bacterium 8AC]
MAKNMLSMLQEENAISVQEACWIDWKRSLRLNLGRDFDANGIAFDLYSDGCNPAEAAQEMRACNYQ